MYFEEHGDGEQVVLMITGMASVMDWFRYNIPALVDAGFRVVAQDLRGSNRDGIAAAPGPYTTEDMARDSLGILDELGVGTAHVVGLSMGGMIAQHLAIRHPERVDKVSIVGNGLARTPKEIADAALGRTDAGGAVSLEDPLADLPEEHRRRAAEAVVFTPTFAAEQPERHAFFADVIFHRHAARPETRAAQVLAAIAHDTLDELGSIKAPVQLLVGDLDAINGGRAEEMADRIVDCDFQVLSGMAHGLNLEHADEYNQLLLGFLRS